MHEPNHKRMLTPAAEMTDEESVKEVQVVEIINEDI